MMSCLILNYFPFDAHFCFIYFFFYYFYGAIEITFSNINIITDIIHAFKVRLIKDILC